MTSRVTERIIYHVSPWRRAVPLYVVTPFLLLAAVLLLFADDAGSHATAVLLVVIMIPVGLGMHLLITYARLEVSPEGIRLRQPGMNLATPWENVAGLRLERGREGVVTRQPLEGAGAANLAATRGLRFYYAPLYNEEQRAAMGERRWIPIEAFAWHLGHGNLQQDIARFAPDVASLEPGVAPPAPSTPAARKRARWLTLGLVGLVLGIACALGFAPEAWVDRVSAVGFALVTPFLAFGLAWRTTLAFRSGARFVAGLFLVLAVLLAFWTVVAWVNLGTAFSVGH